LICASIVSWLMPVKAKELLVERAVVVVFATFAGVDGAGLVEEAAEVRINRRGGRAGCGADVGVRSGAE